VIERREKLKLENIQIRHLEDDAEYLWKLDGQTIIQKGRHFKTMGKHPETIVFVCKTKETKKDHMQRVRNMINKTRSK
jgi:hypothetical protein